MDSYSQQRFAALLFIGEIVGPSSKVSHGDFVRVLGRIIEINAKNLRFVLEHQTYRLEVDTTLLGDAAQILQIGSIFQFIGDIQKKDDELFLRAHFIRQLDGLDLVLYEDALNLKRKFDSFASRETKFKQ